MTGKLALLILFILIFNHSIAYTLRSSHDLDSSEAYDESINLSEEFHNDDQSIDDEPNDDEHEFFKGAQLDFSKYEDFYDIEISSMPNIPNDNDDSELSDVGGTGLKNEFSRWPQVGNKVVVPFEIDKHSKYSKRQERNILDAMKEIQSRTCIKFVKRRYERNFITFNSDSQKGCSSKLGMQEGGQKINLNKKSNCANVPGIIMHEILHSLGFHHMHSHTDRDNYIDIIWKNIEPRRNANYLAIDSSLVSNFNTKYDFYSIMHYPPKAANGKRVIRPKQKYMYYDRYIGQRRTLSDGDVERVNNMYKCSELRINSNQTYKRPAFIQATTPSIRFEPFDPEAFHQPLNRGSNLIYERNHSQISPTGSNYRYESQRIYSSGISNNHLENRASIPDNTRIDLPSTNFRPTWINNFLSGIDNAPSISHSSDGSYQTRDGQIMGSGATIRSGFSNGMIRSSMVGAPFISGSSIQHVPMGMTSSMPSLGLGFSGGHTSHSSWSSSSKISMGG